MAKAKVARWVRYVIGTMPLLLCVVFVCICILFIAIGEGASFIANKLMQIGDGIIAWGDK